MTTNPAAPFHKPELGTETTEHVVMVLRVGAWAIANPVRAPYPTREAAQNHLDETVRDQQAALRNYEDSLAKSPAHDTREIAYLTSIIERERAVEYAIFTRTISPFTRN